MIDAETLALLDSARMTVNKVMWSSAIDLAVGIIVSMAVLILIKRVFVKRARKYVWRIKAL